MRFYPAILTAILPLTLAAAPAKPGTLKAIMVDLGVQMETIQRALWTEDHASIATAAKAIAEHPHVSAEERQRVMGILKSEMADFVAGDRAVHDGALRLADAATRGEMDAVLKELAELQAGCVACHTRFRPRLR